MRFYILTAIVFMASSVYARFDYGQGMACLNRVETGKLVILDDKNGFHLFTFEGVSYISFEQAKKEGCLTDQAQVLNRHQEQRTQKVQALGFQIDQVITKDGS